MALTAAAQSSGTCSLLTLLRFRLPLPCLCQVARFTAFVSGSFAALVLFLAAVNDVLMERHLAGHNLVWWAACLGVVLAVSRGLIGEGTPVFDPEEAMAHVSVRSRTWERRERGTGQRGSC